MFNLVVRKLFKMKWLAVCLIIGCSLAVAVFSSVPVYRDAVLQRMLTKDMEKTYVQDQLYPGMVKLESSVYTGNAESEEKSYDKYELYKSVYNEILSDGIDLPVLNGYERVYYSYLEAYRNGDMTTSSYDVDLVGQDTLPEHIKIVSGRMFSSDKTEDGVIEVIATQQALYNTKMVMNVDYTLMSTTKRTPGGIKIRIVGIFTMADDDTVYWQEGVRDFSNAVVAPYELVTGDFMKDYNQLFTRLTINNNYDYKAIKIADVEALTVALQRLENKFLWAGKVTDPARSIIEIYPQRQSDTSLTLLILQVPLVLILVFYIFMVAKLTIDHDETEISVLKSRGSSKWQILLIYLIESLILGGISLVIGIPLGFLICKVLGFSNGFLEFVSRKAMPLTFSWQAAAFALIAVLVFMITTLLPAFVASKTEIVQLKQKKAQKNKAAVWERFGFDIILLVASIYGLINYRTRQQVIIATGTDSGIMPMDPLMFVMSTAFILGLGLLFLRAYPYIMRFVFKLGQKKWSPTVYASLINVSRSRGQDRFIMLFLIFSISIGIFNATAARTLNQNEEDKASYAAGADLVMGFEWVSVSDDYGNILVSEPDMEKILSVEGVEKATKVLRQSNNTVYGLKAAKMQNVDLMAINASEFLEIAWWRKDILENDISYYLDLLKNESKNVILSTSLKEKLKVDVGDTINIQPEGEKRLNAKVAAFVDYWPTYNVNDSENETTNDLIIMNYNYLQSFGTVQPYEVWCKTDGETKSSVIYQSITDNGLRLLSLTDLSQQLVSSKTDAMLQSVNGTLTMGFVMTMIISAIGFLIFWILSIKSRLLQFGIIRSMGLSSKKLIGMLVWDQIFISLSAILVGTGIGNIVAKLFVPVLQVSADAADQVPPFQMAVDYSDYLKIMIVVAFIIISGLIVLSTIIKKMNVNQTLKLGED